MRSVSSKQGAGILERHLFAVYTDGHLREYFDVFLEFHLDIGGRGMFFFPKEVDSVIDTAQMDTESLGIQLLGLVPVSDQFLFSSCSKE